MEDPDAGYIDVYAQINANYLSNAERNNITNQYYTLRYTVRTNGAEVIMIISNPLPFAVQVHLDFSGATGNRIIKNSEGVDVLFTKNISVYSSNYKTDRNSGIDFTAGTVNDQVSLNFYNNYELDLPFGPLDVHVLRFRMKGAGQIAGKWGNPQDPTTVIQTISYYNEFEMGDKTGEITDKNNESDYPNAIEIVPNPNQGRFSISLNSNSDEKAFVKIYDMYAKQVCSATLTGTEPIETDISSHGKGVYVPAAARLHRVV